MYTLFDFVTHVKGIEYILSLLFIAGFLVLWEALKPTPFRTVTNAGKEDMEHVRQAGGFGYVLKMTGKVAAAPFLGLAYIVMLPVMFFYALFVGVINLALKGGASLIGKTVSFEWRPMEAYLSGRKKKTKGVDTKKDEVK